MKKIVFVLTLVALVAACTPVSGQYVRPPANVIWQDVPQNTTLSFGLNVGGARIVQLRGNEVVSINVPGSSAVVELQQAGLNNYEVVQGPKSEFVFKNYSPESGLGLLIEIGDRKFVFRKNPADTSRWQVYAQ